jgi:predicted amidohydrolase YtcJ
VKSTRLGFARLASGLIVLSACALFLSSCTPASDMATAQSASLVITGARVWTGDETRPWAEAVACRGQEIVAVGTAAEIGEWIDGQTIVIAVEDGLLVPGFIDSHVHLLAGGDSLASVQLRDAKTPEEFTERIEQFVEELEPGEWILNGTWNHKNWGGELPSRDWIDAVTPDNPVFITRLDGHMALANSEALRLAGIDAETAEVEGGTIVRDDSGRPMGVLKDNAMRRVFDVIPTPSEEQLDRSLDAAMQYMAGNGVTTVHDVSADDFDSWISLETYRRAEKNGDLKTRIYSIAPLSDWQRLNDDIATHGRGSEWLKIGGVKGFMDGSLGSHTAAFLMPFSDAPEDSGFLINDLDDMRAWIEGADAAELQVAVHAIGDKAIRDLLDIYRDVEAAHGARDRRFRMEHAQHVHPDDIERFAGQNVIASMQPYHAIDDGQWAEEVIGPERAQTTYAFKSLIDSGAHVAFGSDWYVAPATPLEGIFAAVTRRTLDGENPEGWVPYQKITVEQALHAYTDEAAYASFEEERKGTIEVGKLADMVLLDRDITTIPPETIPETQVVRTIVGGRTVFAAKD